MSSSSDLFGFDAFFRHSPDLPPSDLDFFSDPFSPFPDSTSNGPQLLSSPSNQSQLSNPSLTHLSSSPPGREMNGLSLNPSITITNQLPSANGVVDMSILDTLGLKLEGFETFEPLPAYFDKASLMQRSFSSQSLDRKPGYLFKPQFSSLSEYPKMRTHVPNATENARFGGPIRRACSTGDLQKFNRMQSSYGSPSPLCHESSCMDEAGQKVGRYSAEERKQRIHRYRCKKMQRNFNKTIKYACRKTLADSRPRVRGRFARNDETGETTKAVGNHREEDEEELWVDYFHDEDEDISARGLFGSPQFRCLGF